jgi:hypothetical protein
MSLQEQYGKALEALETVLQAGLPCGQNQVDDVERQVARFRDKLIERLRADTASAREQEQLRQALDHTNAALSLLVGVEYPSAGLQESLLQDAVGLLRQIRLL